MTIEIRPLTMADYDAAYALWKESDGISVGDDDARERIAFYLVDLNGGILGTMLFVWMSRRRMTSRQEAEPGAAPLPRDP